MRTREDKSHPNAFTTAQNVMTSIYDGVTEEKLKDFIAHL